MSVATTRPTSHRNLNSYESNCVSRHKCINEINGDCHVVQPDNMTLESSRNFCVSQLIWFCCSFRIDLISDFDFLSASSCFDIWSLMNILCIIFLWQQYLLRLTTSYKAVVGSYCSRCKLQASVSASAGLVCGTSETSSYWSTRIWKFCIRGLIDSRSIVVVDYGGLRSLPQSDRLRSGLKVSRFYSLVYTVSSR